tara:strand:+ start:106 stop:282 length:177 start_codon:yes stop_codon:yes gene_type:complete
MNLEEQFKYVNKVVKSCVTTRQKINAYRWAESWSERMKSQYPDLVESHWALYRDVISL